MILLRCVYDKNDESFVSCMVNRSCPIAQILFISAGGKGSWRIVQIFLMSGRPMMVFVAPLIHWNKAPILICKLLVY